MLIMANKIYDQTKKFIQALQETDEVIAYTKAVKEFDEDLEAKKLLKDFQEAQQSYAVFRQGQFSGADEKGQEVQELHSKVQKNKKIQALVKNQQAMQSLIGSLSVEISQGIDFPFTQPQRGGCCG